MEKIIQIALTDLKLYCLTEDGKVYYWNANMKNWTEQGE